LEIELTIAGSHHTISLGIILSKEIKDKKSSALKGNGFEDLEPLWEGDQSSRLVVPESQESDTELASFVTNRDRSEFVDEVVDGSKEYVPSPPSDICPINEGGFTLDKLSEVTKDGINLETVADWLGIYLPEEGSVIIGGE
jgi:hypothetical protein